MPDPFPSRRFVSEATVSDLVQQESLAVYADGFQPYEPRYDGDRFDRQYVVHSDGEYAAEDVISIAARVTIRDVTVALVPSRCLKRQTCTLT